MSVINDVQPAGPPPAPAVPPAPSPAVTQTPPSSAPLSTLASEPASSGVQASQQPPQAPSVTQTSELVLAPDQSETAEDANTQKDSSDTKHKKLKTPKAPKLPKLPNAYSDVMKPIIIASVLTAGLMALTIAAYVQGKNNSVQPNTNQNSSQSADTFQAVPLTATDVDNAVEFAEQQSKALDRITQPDSSELTDSALGL